VYEQRLLFVQVSAARHLYLPKLEYDHQMTSMLVSLNPTHPMPAFWSQNHPRLVSSIQNPTTRGFGSNWGSTPVFDHHLLGKRAFVNPFQRMQVFGRHPLDQGYDLPMKEEKVAGYLSEPYHDPALQTQRRRDFLAHYF
jgi:hypothetical protein